MPLSLTDAAYALAIEEYAARGLNDGHAAPFCVHRGSDGQWHFSHDHTTADEARECRNQRRTACALRIARDPRHEHHAEAVAMAAGEVRVQSC